MTTTAQVAALVLGHLDEHDLPEPASLHLSAGFDRPHARVQVHGHTLADTAAVLLAWTESLPAMRVRAWRPPTGTSVHLDVDTTLTGPAGEVAVTIYGGVPFDPARFPDLHPDQSRPVSLGQLTAWAAPLGRAV